MSTDVVVAFDLTDRELGTRRPHEAWDGVPSLTQAFEPGKVEVMARAEALVADLKARAGLGAT